MGVCSSCRTHITITPRRISKTSPVKRSSVSRKGSPPSYMLFLTMIVCGVHYIKREKTNVEQKK